jgi:hypothetical protein
VSGTVNRESLGKPGFFEAPSKPQTSSSPIGSAATGPISSLREMLEKCAFETAFHCDISIFQVKTISLI